MDTTKMLPNGFDYDSQCVAEPKPTGSGNGGACAAATGEPTTQCCGTFPNRFPFNDKGHNLKKFFVIKSKKTCRGLLPVLYWKDL